MVSVIILAWGSSSRFWENKLKTLLWWVPVFLYSLLKFHKRDDIWEIIIVSNSSDISDYELLQRDFPKIKYVVEWWCERQFSVKNWLEKVSWEFVLVHNWANPLVTDEEIDNIIFATKKYWAAVVWRKAKNTLKKVDENWFVVNTVSRHDIYEVQTPQGLKTDKFKELVSEYIIQSKAKNTVVNENFHSLPSALNPEPPALFTDDVSFFEKAWLPVKIVEASEQNFKITTKEDLKKAQCFVRQEIRIWFWHDSHRILERRKEEGESWKWLILWWIKISDDLEFEWNSDWDVLIHSICNAIWTAIWQGSLSLYSDKMCKDWITDSMEYLKHIVQEMRDRWYSVWNLSASIEWARPKLERHIPAMKEKISKALWCSTFQIWIACTTWEWLSSFWKGEWMQVFTNIILKGL